MAGFALIGTSGVRAIVHALDDTSLLGLKVFYWLIIMAVVLFLVALSIYFLQKSRRKRMVEKLLLEQQVMEKNRRELFTDRKADDIASPDGGDDKPETVLSAGRVAYTEEGEMLVFGSSSPTEDDDIVASAVKKQVEAPSPEVPRYTLSYQIEQLLVLHISGVLLLSMDKRGEVDTKGNIDHDLLLVIEGLLEEARWRGGEVVTTTFKDRTVSLCWGDVIHIAAVLRGEPDERLDRELRWAIGDLSDEYADELWSWDEDKDPSRWERLFSRLAEVRSLTEDADLVIETSQSSAGGIKATSTVAWRNGLAEYNLGVYNEGPGAVYDLEILPFLGKEGMVDIMTAEGVEIDAKSRFIIHEIPEGQKVLANFLFRAHRSISVRMECNLVFLRGVANVQKVKLPGRWIHLEEVGITPGEQVEPERVLEIATQPAAFRDRCVQFIPSGVDMTVLFDGIVELLSESFDPVVELEDDDQTQLEAWFHGELEGGGTVVASITVVPKQHLLDLFAASTLERVVPGVLVMLRDAVKSLARRDFQEVLDPEIRSTVPRGGELLVDSWGAFLD